jgi:hypothetical protein
MKRCSVCGRLYSGWQCPCRKTQHSGTRKRRHRAPSHKATATADQIIARGFITYSDPDRETSDEPEKCLRCGTEFVDGRCPACFERWSSECAAAGVPDGFVAGDSDAN